MVHKKQHKSGTWEHVVFDEYESDYYTVGTWPWCNSDIPDTSDIQDIWDEHDIVDDPGTLDDSDIPIGIGYLGDIS
jgi:hypothetical protein